MRFKIRHFVPKRIRIQLMCAPLSFKQADELEYFLTCQEGVESAKVRHRTSCVIMTFKDRGEDVSEILEALRSFKLGSIEVPQYVYDSSGRALNEEYKGKIFNQITKRLVTKTLLPLPLRVIYTGVTSIPYIKEGLSLLRQKRLEVPVLDAAAITAAMAMGDFDTAGSVMFMLGIGETMEEWTRKKSIGDLAKSMSLNISHVWLREKDEERLVSANEVKVGDEIVVHMGNVIPFDGEAVNGSVLVNQASMTGEPLAVEKKAGSTVYAGTVVEEGNLIFKVKEVQGSSRYEQIVNIIEESEKLKSASESKAEHLADKLVPYTFMGTIGAFLLTRNWMRAMSVLMVDYSCALKLAMPVAVLSAIREANKHNINVKGGKFFEAVAEADTIVFDKTGTLTKATPTVEKIISFNDDMDEAEILRIAACLEEHFPHSVATAVVNEAKKRGIEHEELHSEVEYIVAHGIASRIEDKKAIIGSGHFVFDDEGTKIPRGKKKLFDNLPEEFSHLHLAVDGKLLATLCISDPLRDEVPEVIKTIKELGVSRVVMMTGDHHKTAMAIAKQAGIDEVYAEVLPEDKAAFVEKEKAAGHKVIMLGDGINDTPALSAAHVGIAISDGAEIAREIADITISENNLWSIVNLIKLSHALMKRIDSNYKKIIGINSALIGLGVTGLIQPTTSALIHNTSTLAIGLDSQKAYLTEDEEAVDSKVCEIA